jgi:hypothetical protein
MLSALPLRIEFHHPITLGILHVIGEHRRPRRLAIRLAQDAPKVVPVKEVVSQDQCTGTTVEEIRADDKRLRETLGAWLHRVAQLHTPLTAVTQQLLEARRVLGCADDQDVADSGQHQRRERIVNHRLVVDRQ